MCGPIQLSHPALPPDCAALAVLAQLTDSRGGHVSNLQHFTASKESAWDDSVVLALQKSQPFTIRHQTQSSQYYKKLASNMNYMHHIWCGSKAASSNEVKFYIPLHHLS